MKVAHSLLATGVLGLVALSVPVAAQATAPAKKSTVGQVYVVQGLPDKSVTVAIDGGDAKTLTSQQVLGGLTLGAGAHKITFSGTHPNWTMHTSVSVSGGSSLDVVLHRPASVAGKPVVNVYTNDLKSAGAGKGRVVVAHTAVVPPADILVDGKVIFSNIANGEYATADVPAGKHVVKILPAGQKSPVLLGPVTLNVEAGKLTRVFAVGRPANGSMNVIVQRLSLASTGDRAPTAVPLGSAGLVAHWHVNVTAAPAAHRAGSPAVDARYVAPALVGGLALLGGAGLLGARRGRSSAIDRG